MDGWTDGWMDGWMLLWIPFNSSRANQNTPTNVLLCSIFPPCVFCSSTYVCVMLERDVASSVRIRQHVFISCPMNRESGDIFSDRLRLFFSCWFFSTEQCFLRSVFSCGVCRSFRWLFPIRSWQIRSPGLIMTCLRNTSSLMWRLGRG